jgi:hypothetical protein
MGLPISIVFFGAIAAATLYMAIVHIFQLRRAEHASLEELDRRSEQLFQELERLDQLQGKERQAACRAIARAMRWESLFLLRIVDDWFYENSRKNAAHAELAVAAFREASALRWMVVRILFLMRFTPSLLNDCHRLREATLQFGRMWTAFQRLWQAQFKEVELPET